MNETDFWAAPRYKKAAPGSTGVPFAFQKKQTVRFAPALSILAAEQSGNSSDGCFL
jgi:hypothetical protein